MDPEAEPQETPKDEPLKQIRTFEGDIADAIKKQSESLVSIQRAEKNRQSTTEEAPDGSTLKALALSLFALILFAGAIYGAYYAYGTYKEKTAPPVLEAPENQIIPAQSVVNIDASTLSRIQLIKTLSSERSKSRKEGELEQIELRRGPLPTSEPLSTADFLTRLASHAPSALVRALDASFEFLYWSSPAHGALIVKLDSFENTFPGMLSWETSLAADVGPIFSDADITGVWKDETIDNRDVRAYKDATGATHLLYGYFNNNMLIIVGNEDDFRLIVDRLASQELTR